MVSHTTISCILVDFSCTVVGASKQEMPNNLFKKGLKKPASKSLKVSKINFGFLVFAAIILPMADKGLQFLVGGAMGSHYADCGLQGDVLTFAFSVVIFCILDFIYTNKYHAIYVTAGSKSDEAPATTKVDDTFDKKRFALRGAMCGKKNTKPHHYDANVIYHNPPLGVPARTSVSHNGALPRSPLQPSPWHSEPPKFPVERKAEKCMPIGPSTAFAHVGPSTMWTFEAHETKEEEELMRSNCGRDDVGVVLYKSRHWSNNILSKQSSRGHLNPDLKSNEQTDARKKSKKWIDLEDVGVLKWKSSHSMYKTNWDL